MIKNSNKINFGGTFRIKAVENKAKKEIPALFTKNRQIFHDILEKGDEVIIIRDQHDKIIGKYIQENGIKNIEYYHEINTKSGLDDQKPEGLIKLIKDKTTRIITDLDEMLSVISKQRKVPKAPKSKNEIEKISNALRLYIENPQIHSTEHSTIIRDNEKRRTIEIIMKNKGNTYVYVRPDSLCEDSIRCIIDGKGNIMKSFETPDEIHKFIKKFKNLKDEKVNLLKDK